MCSGGANEFIKNLGENNGNLQFFKNFHKLREGLWFSEAHLNKNKGKLADFLKIFSNYKRN